MPALALVAVGDVYGQHHGDSDRGPWAELAQVPLLTLLNQLIKRLISKKQVVQLSKMLEMGLKPSDILTREAFEDAITVTMALGGSTNATLHLLAIAHAANVDLTLEDFNDFKSAYLTWQT